MNPLLASLLPHLPLLLLAFTLQSAPRFVHEQPDFEVALPSVEWIRRETGGGGGGRRGRSADDRRLVHPHHESAVSTARSAATATGGVRRAELGGF
ncbi:MAG: hypothetical protein EXS13_14885 [Planctomycetes bacterium]|nr:hypothetical protein [Planctomycetota bacterium]